MNACECKTRTPSGEYHRQYFYMPTRWSEHSRHHNASFPLSKQRQDIHFQEINKNLCPLDLTVSDDNIYHLNGCYRPSKGTRNLNVAIKNLHLYQVIPYVIVKID